MVDKPIQDSAVRSIDHADPSFAHDSNTIAKPLP